MPNYNPNWARIDLIPRGAVILPATTYNGPWIEAPGTHTIERVVRLMFHLTKSAGGAISIPTEQMFLQVSAQNDGSTGVIDVPIDNVSFAAYNIFTPCAGQTTFGRTMELRMPGPFVRAVIIGDGVDQYTFNEALSLYIPSR